MLDQNYLLTLIVNLTNKITQTQQDLERTRTSESDKVKKIERLESKLNELTKIKKEMVDKQTQTDLTSKQIEEMEKVMEQLRQIKIPPK